MGDISKTIDAVIKAPLWAYFAAMLATWIPMFNTPNLAGTGVDSNFKLLGVPLSFYALGFTALFLSSATARSWSWLCSVGAPGVERAQLWWRLRMLPERSRALLYVLEDDNLIRTDFLPDDPALRPVRDKALLATEFVGADRTWSTIHLSAHYERLMRKHRDVVRRATRVDGAKLDEIRGTIRQARRHAMRRI